MSRTWVFVSVVVGAFVSCVSPSRAQVNIPIFGPNLRSYPVAVSPLRNLSQGTPSDVGTRFADIVSRDLTIAGYFKVIDRAAYIEKPEASGYTAEASAEGGIPPINFDSWSVIGALALVKGAYTVEGDNVSVEVRLFDVFQRKLLYGRKYRGPATEIRRMANKFADEIMKQFTGERGPFDSRLAFVSTRDSARNGRLSEIYVTSVDEGDLKQLTMGQTVAKSPSWNPDNRSLLYTSFKRHNPDLFSIDLLGGRETLISQRPGLNLGGKWSPDGSLIALTVEDNGNSDIVLLDRTGKLVRRLTDNWAIDVSSSWSPDGRQIAFCSNRGGTPQIYVMSADGGAARRVTFTGNNNTAPAWSPKGDVIAYVSRLDGGFNLFTVKVDGSDVHQLTQGAGDNEDPSWAPDGRYIVFTSSRSGRKKLFVTDAAGASQVQLTHGGGDDTSPAWSRWLE